MDDTFLVRRLQRVRDLMRNGQRVIERHRPTRQPLGEILAVHELHDQRADAVGFFEPVNVGDVRMVERGERLRFAGEAPEPIRIGGEGFRQDLQRDVAIEPRVARAVDLAHSTGAKRSKDFIRANASAGV